MVHRRALGLASITLLLVGAGGARLAPEDQWPHPGTNVRMNTCNASSALQVWSLQSPNCAGGATPPAPTPSPPGSCTNLTGTYCCGVTTITQHGVQFDSTAAYGSGHGNISGYSLHWTFQTGVSLVGTIDPKCDTIRWSNGATWARIPTVCQHQLALRDRDGALCLRVRGAQVSAAVSLEMFGCNASGAAAVGDMAWSFGNTSNLTHPGGGTEIRTLAPSGEGYCVDVSAPSAIGESPQDGPVEVGSNLQLMPCDPSGRGARQRFHLDESTGLLRSMASATMCLEAASASFRVPLTCSDPPLRDFAFCDTTRSLQARVNDMVQRATLAEQMLNMEQRAYYSHGIPRIGIPPTPVGVDFHGVLAGCGAKHADGSGCPTVFPSGPAVGASYNRSQWRAYGRAVAVESRGLHNQPEHSGIYGAEDGMPPGGIMGAFPAGLIMHKNVNLIRE